MMEQTPFPEKGKRREEGRQAPAPQPEPRRDIMMEQNPFPEQRKRRGEIKTSTGTGAGTKRNQHIMMEQNPFLEKKEDTRRETSTRT